MNGSPPTSSGGISPSELAAMLRKSADIVERKEFHPVLFQSMRALTAYAGEYANGGIAAAAPAVVPPPSAAPSSAATTAAASAQQQPQQKSRRRDAAAGSGSGDALKDSVRDRDPPGKKKSAFHDVPDNLLESSKGLRGSVASSSGGAAAAAERVGAPGGQFSSAAAAASSANNKQENNQTTSKGHKGVFSGLKGIKKGIEKIGADILGDHDKSKDDAPFDEYAWCDEHFTRGCNCKSRKNAANNNTNEFVKPSGSNESSSGQPQQTPSANAASNINTVNDPEKPAKPCFQRPINPSSNLIANGWIDQQRRSKMRVVWKDVLASLVEGRRPGEETTLWIQRQVTNSQTGKVTGLEALHQIPMKWLEDVNYVDLYGDHRFTLKVFNIAEEFYFKTRDEQSAQSWVLTLRSARDASLEGGNNRMAGATSSASGNGSVATEKKPNAKDMGLHDLDDWDTAKQQQSQEGGPPLAQAGSDGGGADSRPSSSSSSQPMQPTPVRMPISELRAIAHGAGYNTRGMERQDLERIAAYVRSGGFNQQQASAPTSAGPAPDINQSRQQEAAMREAEQRAAAEKREKEQKAAQEEARRQQKENEERAVVEKMRREREAAEKKRVEEQQMAEQQRQRQEFEQQAADIKRRQEEERQRKMAELQAQERARQQQAQVAAAAAERKKREEDEHRRRQQQQQQQQKAQQHQQARGPGSIPTPPTSGGYPQQGNFQQQPQWGQQQQQQHYQQWQQQQQQQHQQQHPHFQQQGFPGQQQPHQQQHPHQNFFNQNMPHQGGAYQQQQQQQQHSHFQQQPQQQQQQPGANTQGSAAFNNSKYMEEKDSGEDQSACTLQIKRSILINWALQPPNLNVLRPIDQLITSIHTAMPPAYGVSAHAYFTKFTPIATNELVVSSAMGNHPDETKLKKAVRKVRVFLHPDKLPRDLTSDQQFMARMLWDITSDSWEEFQKHKDELDWIRS
ncbi:hypothetical protein ACHAXR_012790 [Thalassiosira sp. AJA248-18]